MIEGLILKSFSEIKGQSMDSLIGGGGSGFGFRSPCSDLNTIIYNAVQRLPKDQRAVVKLKWLAPHYQAFMRSVATGGVYRMKTERKRVTEKGSTITWYEYEDTTYNLSDAQMFINYNGYLLATLCNQLNVCADDLLDLKLSMIMKCSLVNEVILKWIYPEIVTYGKLAEIAGLEESAGHGSKPFRLKVNTATNAINELYKEGVTYVDSVFSAFKETA